MSLKCFERLKSKMHIFITDNNQGSKKAKDIITKMLLIMN